MSRGYYIRDASSGGDTVLWWCPNRNGYTADLDQAGVYTEEEARAIERLRGTDIAHRVEDVEALAIRVVPYTSNLTDAAAFPPQKAAP